MSKLGGGGVGGGGGGILVATHCNKDRIIIGFQLNIVGSIAEAGSELKLIYFCFVYDTINFLPGYSQGGSY